MIGVNYLNMKKFFVAIVGPTASGKSDLAVEVAQRIGGEIVSADSMQIYKYMNIGTAKPSSEMLAQVKHHMIDIVEPSEEFSVAMFKDKVTAIMHEIINRGKIPVIVGGTGLFIRSLTDQVDYSDFSSDDSYRVFLTELAQQHGNDYLHERLHRIDPTIAEKLHANDLRRIIRALEVYRFTGKKLSQWQCEALSSKSEWEYSIIGITASDRALLYARIEQRVDEMIANGFIEEVKMLLERGFNDKLQSMQAIGYKHLIQYLKGVLSLEEAIELIKRDSRRYAKRQLTWFRRDERIAWYFTDKQSRDEITAEIVKIIKTSN